MMQNKIDPNNGCAISVSDVTLRYSKSQAAVLDNVSLTVPAGSIYCLLGPSGCGKTSLLKVIKIINKSVNTGLFLALS